MRLRWGAIWLGILGLTQFADVWTTAIDRSRGTVEAFPFTAALLAQGGWAEYATFKALLLAVLTIVSLVTWHWSRRKRGGAVLYGMTIGVARIGAVMAAMAGLHNAVLFTSL